MYERFRGSDQGARSSRSFCPSKAPTAVRIPGSSIKQALTPNRLPLLIAIDGADGVGKSSLASAGNAPCFLERSAGPVEGRGRRRLGYSRGCDPRIEAARPAPRVLVRWNADPLRDRADADVAVIDVPAFILGFGIAAAGEGGHALLKRSGCADAIRPSRENKQRSAVYRPCTMD